MVLKVWWGNLKHQPGWELAGPHPRGTEATTLGREPRNLCFNKPSRWLDAAKVCELLFCLQFHMKGLGCCLWAPQEFLQRSPRGEKTAEGLSGAQKQKFLIFTFNSLIYTHVMGWAGDNSKLLLSKLPSNENPCLGSEALSRLWDPSRKQRGKDDFAASEKWTPKPLKVATNKGQANSALQAL